MVGCLGTATTGCCFGIATVTTGGSATSEGMMRGGFPGAITGLATARGWPKGDLGDLGGLILGAACCGMDCTGGWGRVGPEGEKGFRAVVGAGLVVVAGDCF